MIRKDGIIVCDSCKEEAESICQMKIPWMGNVKLYLCDPCYKSYFRLRDQEQQEEEE